MKKITLIALAIIWILSLAVLIIALTNLFPDNIFKNYRLIAGIGFVAITGFIRTAYKNLIKQNKL
ncbi:hypothetical protein [Chryseobacterium sp.]|uniref:hypothetical protein n=1 Tax=Chryseobacterium sp. TaxID=1871047 RepID=UPI0011CA4244|nr:hypothetical protein [Chryseobacterium sp.]TXF79281.1 hypothetical protein FUA25_02500 [Chryseobacterium sp.]